ncbi:MAG: TRAP transporter substrate-binding protein DctP [Pseudomonadota bacterium]
MIRIVLAVITVLAGMHFFSPAPAETKNAKIVLKIATLAPKASANSMDRFRELVREQTKNEVDFKVYYGGVQGDEDDMLRKIRFGQLDGAAFSGHGLGKIVPEVRVTELPYLFWNYGEVSHVRKKLENTMNRLFAENGFFVMGWGEAGFVYSFSKVPVTSIEIARQQKWWLWDDDPVAKAFYDALGISPISLSLTDVLTSLNTRMIDTAGITPYGAVALRWYTRFQYMSEYPVMNAIAAMVVTQKSWEKVSPSSREAIVRIIEEHFKDAGTAHRIANEKSIQVLKTAGISVVRVDLDTPEAKFVLDASRKTREALVGRLYSRELLDQTLAYLAEYRAEHPDSAIMKIE